MHARAAAYTVYNNTYTRRTRAHVRCISHARVRMASKGVILPGYKDTLTDLRSKERYQEKLKLLNGIDPYELPREAWKDDVDIWPCITNTFTWGCTWCCLRVPIQVKPLS